MRYAAQPSSNPASGASGNPVVTLTKIPAARPRAAPQAAASHTWERFLSAIAGRMHAVPGVARRGTLVGGRRQPLRPRRLDEAELVGTARGLGPGAAAELGEHVADVHVDRARAEEQLVRDLAVRATDCDESDDLELSASQATVLEVRMDEGPQSYDAARDALRAWWAARS